MTDQAPADSKMPVLIAAMLVVLGLVVAAIGSGGIKTGSIGGGLLAGAGALPACFGMWKGIQQETQGTLALSVGMALLALAVGAVLIGLRVFHWIA